MKNDSTTKLRLELGEQTLEKLDTLRAGRESRHDTIVRLIRQAIPYTEEQAQLMELTEKIDPTKLSGLLVSEPT